MTPSTTPETAAERAQRLYRAHLLDPFRPSHLAALDVTDRAGNDPKNGTAMKLIPFTKEHFRLLASRPVKVVRRPTEVVTL